MADNVLGSISIVITGDSSQLEASLKSSVSSAQSAGEKISSAFSKSFSGAAGAIRPLQQASETFAQSYERILSQFHAGEIGAKQAEKAFASLRAEESACAKAIIELDTAQAAQANSQKALASLVSISAASQRAATQEVRGAAQGAKELGAASNQATYGLRYMIFGLKDIGEGRYRYALAEMVNVLLRLGPVALAAGAALAVVGGTIYYFTEFKNKIQDAKDASDKSFGSIVSGLRVTNDELDVSREKLQNEIRLLENKPVNRTAEAMAELRLESDKAAESLQETLNKLNEALSKDKISWGFGLISSQAPTTALEDTEKKFARESRQIERNRQLAIAKNPDDLKAINAQYDKELDAKRTFYEKEAKMEMPSATTGSSNRLGKPTHAEFGSQTDTATLKQQGQDFIDSLELQKAQAAGRAAQLAEQQKKQGLEDGKKGIEDARALAVAKIEAQQKVLQEQTELEKRASEAQIEADHAVVQRQIAGMVDRKAAATAEAAEEVRMAQAKESAITADHAANTKARIDAIKALGAAEKQGKTGTEQQTIGIKTDEKLSELDTSQKLAELDAARVTAEKQTASVVKQITESRERDLEALKEIGKQLDENNARVELYRNLAIQLKEIREKGSGNEAELKATKEKLEAERAYATSAGHTYQQDIDYAVRIAAIEEKARQAKIAGIQAELATAQAAVNSPESTDEERANQAKIAARLQVQIRDLQAHADSANYEANTKILEKILAQNQALQAQKTILDALTNWSQISVGTAANQFAQTLVALPQQIGDSLARSIFEAPKHGRSKGAEIGQGLAKTAEKSGEQLAGKLITDAIEKLVVQLVGQAALTTLSNSVTVANTAALAALTAAIGGETAATAAGGEAGGLGGILGKALGWLGGIIGLDKGGPISHDMLAVVHAGEHVLTADQVSGRAPMPPKFIQNAARSMGGSVTNNSSSGGNPTYNFHVHGVQDGHQMLRTAATLIKAQTRKYSPLNS